MAPFTWTVSAGAGPHNVGLSSSTTNHSHDFEQTGYCRPKRGPSPSINECGEIVVNPSMLMALNMALS